MTISFNPKQIILISSGDSRLPANQNCWETQARMENLLAGAVSGFGFEIQRGHDYNPVLKHGFIDSQKMGIAVFEKINPFSPIIVAESVWQYSHHVLAGLSTHKGPILTVANWEGQWPGLVGMLNLNGSLTKAGVSFSTLWSEKFDDTFFLEGLEEWLCTGKIKHDTAHVKDYDLIKIPLKLRQQGIDFAKSFRNKKAIMGVFDEGCMGMYNAIVPDHLLHATGIFKERLSQSALYAEMLRINDADAQDVLSWLINKGMSFEWGTDPVSELTKEQSLEQCKMYIAAGRLADHFGCQTIGIQYQQGLKDLTAASDLVEGLLNCSDRPPVYHENGEEVFAGEAIPHFNEVDECAGMDSLLTYKLWKLLGMNGDNTLHDIRWGENYIVDDKAEFVWVFEISGAIPASHIIGGYSGASSVRQPSMFFPKGGGTLKGISKPGKIVWSRIYVMNDQLHCDMGTGRVVELSAEETHRRWNKTNNQWPIMHAVLDGVTRDQLMARHQSNHIHVVYVEDLYSPIHALHIKAAAFDELGIKVHYCGIN